MKKLFSVILAGVALSAAAQPKKAPKMAPTLADGYYVVAKGDTVKGQVQTNPEDETEFYHKFSFKPAKGGKVMPVDPKKAKAYGFDGRDFVLMSDGEEMYVERLATGRLNFFEYKHNGKNDDGYPAVVADYYIQDTRAEGGDTKLKDMKKLAGRKYRDDLKPYMKDQPMIWTDLDKFKFDKTAVVNAVNEFNKYYVPSAE